MSASSVPVTMTFFRRLLIAQFIDILAVIQHVRGAVDDDAGNGAVGVGRSHLHVRMIAVGALAIRNRAGERLRVLCCGHRGK